MSGSFRNVTRILNDYSAIEPLMNKILSIGLTSDGFLFAVMEPEKSKYLALEEYRLLDDGTDADILNYMADFIASHQLLNNSFLKTHISLFVPQYVIVPEALFDPADVDAYFSFCAGSTHEQTIMYDRLNGAGAFGIYAVSEQLISFCQKNFKDCRIRHQASVLIESTVNAASQADQHANVVVHLEKYHFMILILCQKKLLCYQSYVYQAFDDVLYHLFSLLEQFNLDANHENLFLVGDIQINSNEYVVFERFFNRIILPDRNASYKFTAAFDQLPAYSYHNLFNLAKCE